MGEGNPKESTKGDITQLLIAFRQGDRGAMDQIFPLVYDELRVLARGQLSRRRGGNTLNTTALVHEAYLKLIEQSRADWNDRAHFRAVAAVAMRHILVDYARRRGAVKRGGEAHQTLADDNKLGLEVRVEEILAIDEALDALAELNERLAKLVELRFFGGLTVEETAEAMGTSERTVKRDWRKARAFLFDLLKGEGETS